MPPVARPIADRFWPKVDRRGPDECWPWTGSCRGFGHGQIGTGGRGTSPAPVHRVSWEIHNGPIPPGLLVLHKCDNPPCVNPAHLFLGTQADNMADMDRKGRRRSVVRPGDTNPNAKLTGADVEEIRHRLLAGGFVIDIAKDFGISLTHVYYIRDGKSWGGTPLPRLAPSTHCRRGHEMTEANMGGQRKCRACCRDSARARDLARANRSDAHASHGDGTAGVRDGGRRWTVTIAEQLVMVVSIAEATPPAGASHA